MTLYVCLDDKNGMLFNNRRQSRDRVVLEDIRMQARFATYCRTGYMQLLMQEQKMHLAGYTHPPGGLPCRTDSRVLRFLFVH